MGLIWILPYDWPRLKLAPCVIGTIGCRCLPLVYQEPFFQSELAPHEDQGEFLNIWITKLHETQSFCSFCYFDLPRFASIRLVSHRSDLSLQVPHSHHDWTCNSFNVILRKVGLLTFESIFAVLHYVHWTRFFQRVNICEPQDPELHLTLLQELVRVPRKLMVSSAKRQAPPTVPLLNRPHFRNWSPEACFLPHASVSTCFSMWLNWLILNDIDIN